MNPKAIRCIAVMGATATGKSDLAIALALRVGGEIISIDSRQVYRGFDVGTGKVGARDRGRVPHHLIDILGPDETSTAGRHAELARATASAIAARGAVPVLAGGTALYFRVLFHGVAPVRIPRAEQSRIRAGFVSRDTAGLYDELRARDPGRAAVLSRNDRVRITRALEIIEYTGLPASRVLARRDPQIDGFAFLKLVLTMPRERLRERIEARTLSLFEAGWADEVRRLLDAGVAADAPAMNSLGYGELAAAIGAGEDPTLRLARVVAATRQYAKRQETFFRSEHDAVWIDVSEPGAHDRAIALAEAFLSGQALRAPQ